MLRARRPIARLPSRARRRSEALRSPPPGTSKPTQGELDLDPDLGPDPDPYPIPTSA